VPLPERRKGEAHKDFIDRCMGDEAMVREFPDAAQRRAVCERQAKAEAADPPAEASAKAGPLSIISEPGALTIEAAAADGDGKPRLPRFTMVAYTGGPMRINAWRFPVVLDLAGLAIPSQSRPIRFGHDVTAGVGHTDSIRVEDGKLLATGIVSRDTPAAKEIVASARNGFPWQASIGAQVEQFEFVREKQTVVVNGREFNGPVNVVRRATLGEISFVDLGADAGSSASVAASARQEKGIMDETKTDKTKTAAEEAGKDPASASATPGQGKEAPKVEAQAATGTEASPPVADSPLELDPVADMRAKAAAEQERIAAVRKVCGDAHADIAAKAIAEGWDVTRTELEVLRTDRPKPPDTHVPDRSMTGPILEAACMLTGGVKGDALLTTYGEQALDAADKRFRGGIGLQELLLEAAWANGYDGRTFRDSRAVLRFAFRQDVQAAGFSTIDIGGILSNVANKFLLEGFFSVERVWAGPVRGRGAGR